MKWLLLPSTKPIGNNNKRQSQSGVKQNIPAHSFLPPAQRRDGHPKVVTCSALQHNIDIDKVWQKTVEDYKKTNA